MSHTKNKNLIYLFIVIFFISCEGEVGPQGIGLNSLTSVTSEPAGSNCENGGVKIEIGTDSNENGVLDSDEVLNTSYVCNGVDGATSLTVVTTEPAGTNCENGGLKIDSGVDANSDGTLDDTEISATAYVCNGLDGSVSLVNISDESAGANCSNGGVKIESGTDTDGNSTLDIGEVQITRYICNGIDGGFDEQIRIHLASSTFQTGTSLTSGESFGGITSFNIDSWQDIDSVTFVVNKSVVSSGTVGAYELFDFTNSNVISTLTTSSTDLITIESLNIYSEFPVETIELQFRLRKESGSGSVSYKGVAELLLYR